MKSRFLAGLAVTALCVTVVGCKHKVDVAKATPSTPVNTPSGGTTPRQVTQQPPARSAETAASSQSRMPDAATRARIQELLNRIQDAYFDYDQHTIRTDAQAALQKDAQTLAEIIKQYPDFKLTVQGYCDERGSEEYNLALGDARAKQAKEYLASMGLPGDQLRTISYGKDKPVCTAHDEECWQRNRRAHITQAQ
ncbi:MAG TPA: OmpA family protein [Bryobacteraceae bacterium]|nr:OmpA family protein [Bryobacteraceae bacterium]